MKDTHACIKLQKKRWEEKIHNKNGFLLSFTAEQHTVATENLVHIQDG